MELYVPIVVVSCCLVAEAFFSGSEIALIASDKIRLRQWAEEGDRRSEMLLRLMERPQRLFGVTLVGTNLAVVASTTVLTLYLVGQYGPTGDKWTMLIMSPLVLLFGEIVPKTWFRARAERASRRVVGVLWLFSYLFAPLVFMVSKVTDVFLRLLRVEEKTRKAFVTREELQAFLRMSQAEGQIPTSERRMISRIFQFATKPVREVMIPLSDVSAVEQSESVEHAVAIVEDKGYSRLPTYNTRIDNIQGILHSFDLLTSPDTVISVRGLARPALFVPETQLIDDLLERMRREGHGMAVVVDEYGGAVGVVTVEDLLEEIVGEIEDEHDPEEASYRRIGHQQYLVAARMGIEEVNEAFGLSLPPGDYQTLAGFLLDRLRRFPMVGEQIRLEGAVMTISRVSDRAVIEVRLKLLGMTARGRPPPKPPPTG